MEELDRILSRERYLNTHWDHVRSLMVILGWCFHEAGSWSIAPFFDPTICSYCSFLLLND